MPSGRHIWHFLWAKFFNLFSLKDSNILFKSQIIHLLQTYLAFFSIYVFSKVIIRNIFFNISHIHTQYLALWSTIIWFTIYATQSMYYHLVWNLWYSVNYQITLPLFFYITALTIILFFEKTSSLKKVFFILQILLISRFILQAHSMEFMYFIMYMSVLGIIYIKDLFRLIKKYPISTVSSLITILFMMKYIQPDHSKILDYLSYEKIPILFENIMTSGEKLIHGYNRASASINELIYLNIFLGSLILSAILYHILKKKKTLIHLKMYLFLFVTSLLVVIPLFQFSSGLSAVITKITAVNRIYYSSSIFLILPVFVYYFSYYLHEKRIQTIAINISIFLSLLAIYFYSSFFKIVNQNYAKNINSLYQSFSPKIYAFNLSPVDIRKIGIILDNYEQYNTTKKPLYFYARDDISFVLKFIYRKDVLWHPRGIKNYIKSYQQDHNLSHTPILFETPTNFTPYVKYQ